MNIINKDKLIVPITNLSLQTLGTANLRSDIFGISIRQDILQRVVVWQNACKRQGTASVKGIDEVSGSGKKPHRQKGTGKARQGSKRAPHMRGGATIFGPRPKDWSYTLPKKIKAAGLKHALATKYQQGKLLVWSEIEPLEQPKTKIAQSKISEVIQNLDTSTCIKKKPKLLLVSDEFDDAWQKSTNRVLDVHNLKYPGINVFDILKHDFLVLTKDVLDKLQIRLANHDPRTDVVE